MKPNLRIIFAFILIISVTACTENIITECDVPLQNDDDAVTFTFIQEEVFNKSCATAGCHAGPNPASGLDLTAGNSYDNLVHVQSVQAAKNRIEPGSSTDSYIIDKLRGNNTSQMPPGGSLNPALIDSIASWIDNGALRN